MKYRRIIIEGVDKVGKTMLYKYLHHITNYKYYIQARGEISQEIYDKAFDRKAGFKANIEKDALYILLTCSSEKELQFRLSFDQNALDIHEIWQQQEEFKEYFKKHLKSNQKMIFDISKKTLNQIGEEILCNMNQK